MDEDFWKRITRQLAYARIKRGMLLTLFLSLGFAGFLLLIVARAAFDHSGEVQWSLILSAAACIGVAILVRIYFERC